MNRRSFLALSGMALPALAQHHGAAEMPPANEILHELQAGNARFAAGHAMRPHADLPRVHEVAAAQAPRAVVLTCSDSRVPPEYLFDQGFGDLFVVRVAGNVANNDEIASAEYAVDHFGTPLLVVLGHSSCGAVSAVVNGEHVPEEIQRMVVHIGEAVEKTRKAQPRLQGAELIAASVRANVLETIEDLRCGPIIASRVREGKLKVVGAIYNLADGKVSWL
jgi:carbonic anhydrase